MNAPAIPTEALSGRPDAAPTASATRVELALDGMTCAACAARIEKVLNRVPGTQASVNFATESAVVRYDPATAPIDALLETVKRAGYGVEAVTLLLSAIAR